MREFVDYKGSRYHLQSNDRYFNTRYKVLGERLLHRVVWTEHNGSIPEGHDIHHKDENWRNSDIDNLECLPMFDHRSAHMKDRLADPEYYQKALNYLALGQEAAKEWHKSDEGSDWHKQHGKNTLSLENRPVSKHVCTVCNNEFETKDLRKTIRFCSNACEVKLYYKTKLSARVCEHCKALFEAYKYSKTRYCGYKCSANARHHKSGQFKVGGWTVVS